METEDDSGGGAEDKGEVEEHTETGEQRKTVVEF